jgi:hypothetical protein
MNKIKFIAIFAFILCIAACSNDEPIVNVEVDGNETPEGNEEPTDTTQHWCGDLFSSICDMVDMARCPYEIQNYMSGAYYHITVPTEGCELTLYQNPDAYFLYRDYTEESKGINDYKEEAIPIPTEEHILWSVAAYHYTDDADLNFEFKDTIIKPKKPTEDDASDVLMHLDIAANDTNQPRCYTMVLNVEVFNYFLCTQNRILIHQEAKK